MVTLSHIKVAVMTDPHIPFSASSFHTDTYTDMQTHTTSPTLQAAFCEFYSQRGPVDVALVVRD